MHTPILRATQGISELAFRSNAKPRRIDSALNLDVLCHLGARHRRHPDHHGADRHAAEASADERRHHLSGHRLCARPGGLGADDARPVPVLRRAGKNGGSRAADLALCRRAETRRPIARQALVPAVAPGISVDDIDRDIGRGDRHVPARTARGCRDPARRNSRPDRSRARIRRAGGRFVGSRPPPLQPDRRGRSQRWRRVSHRAVRSRYLGLLRLRQRLALACGRRVLGHRGWPGDRWRPGGVGREAGPLSAHAASGGRRSRRVPGAWADRDRLWRRAAQLTLRAFSRYLPQDWRCSGSRSVRSRTIRRAR